MRLLVLTKFMIQRAMHTMYNMKLDKENCTEQMKPTFYNQRLFFSLSLTVWRQTLRRKCDDTRIIPGVLLDKILDVQDRECSAL